MDQNYSNGKSLEGICMHDNRQFHWKAYVLNTTKKVTFIKFKMFKNSNLAVFLNASADRRGYDDKKRKKDGFPLILFS